MGIQVSGTERVLSIFTGLREIVREEEAEKGRAEQRSQVEGEGRNENKGRDGVGKERNDAVGQARDGEDDGVAQRKVPNFVNAYKPDSDLEAECREWDMWDWRVEVCPCFPLLLSSPSYLFPPFSLFLSPFPILLPSPSQPTHHTPYLPHSHSLQL